MTDYKETQVTGEITQWKRTNVMVIDNILNKIPSILFHEEIATRLPDGSTFTKPDGAVKLEMTDMEASIQIIDMATGTPKGVSINFKEIYDIVASLYLDLAIKRDVSEGL